MIKKNMLQFFVFLCFICKVASIAAVTATTSTNTTAAMATTENWTELHSLKYSARERTDNKQKEKIMFSKIDVKPFTQLIFSWNIIRPEKGHFSFFVQVRDAQTKQWSKWHHMSDWGAVIQCSYASKSDGLASFVHVRLEIDTGKKGDAFHIQIQSHDGAFLSYVHGLFVTLAHFALFKPENSVSFVNQLPSVFIRNVPKIAQYPIEHPDNTRICSPVSCTMVMRFIIGKKIDPILFSYNSFDTGLAVYGSWPFNSAHAFEYSSNKNAYCYVQRLDGFAQLHKKLEQGMPVVVSVRGYLPGAFKSFPHGHLLVVVGWDAKTGMVICHDPAAECDGDVVKHYALEHFLAAWERSYRLSYVTQRY